MVESLADPLALVDEAPESQVLPGWAARYLGREFDGDKPLNSVARFRLDHGARVERLSRAADPSAKGLRQSWGLIVDYLYDPKRLDRNRASLARGEIPVSGAIEALYR